jgi:hypothetical protein
MVEKLNRRKINFEDLRLVFPVVLRGFFYQALVVFSLGLRLGSLDWLLVLLFQYEKSMSLNWALFTQFDFLAAFWLETFLAEIYAVLGWLGNLSLTFDSIDPGASKVLNFMIKIALLENSIFFEIFCWIILQVELKSPSWLIGCFWQVFLLPWNPFVSLYWVYDCDYFIVSLTGFTWTAGVFIAWVLVLKRVLGNQLDCFESLFVDWLSE